MKKLFLVLLSILGFNTLKLNSQTTTTYSILSTAYNRATGSFQLLGSVDGYWFLTRMEDMVVPSNPASVILYPNNPTYVVANSGNNTFPGIIANHSINTNGTTTSLGAKVITYRTYFTLPNLNLTSNRYSLAFKLSADDAVDTVKLNGKMKGVFLDATYNNIPGVTKPYLLTIPVCDPDFVSGQNYIDVSIADAAGSVGFYGEVILYQVTNSSNTQMAAASLCGGTSGTAAVSLTTTVVNPSISYTWTNSSGAVVSQTNNTGSLTNSVTGLPNGTYTVQASLNASCNAVMTETVMVNCSVATPTAVCGGKLTGTGMGNCSQYNFTISPTQTITPLNYGSQGYACTGATMPDVSFNIMGGAWRVMKNNWNFTATTSGLIRGFDGSGTLQVIPFPASNTITPLSYSGSMVQFAINGVSAGPLLSQANFSISLDPVVFGGNSYTYCASTATSVAISPVSPSTGGPWTYNWMPGNIPGNPATVSPAVTTNYTVTATTPAGCTSTANVAVTVTCTTTPTVPLCSGNLGAPVFMEDFGSGGLYGPPLPPGVTSYPYQTGVPGNGTYVIANSSNPSGTNAGYITDGDHTGNTNGYMMVVNSDYAATEVYRRHVTGLCPGTTYVFSAYLANNNSPDAVNIVCGASYVNANIKFQVEYPLGTPQGSVSSGNLQVAPTATSLPWIQYGFAFTTVAGQTSADVVLLNNAPGGCGNDYVVDDISLSPCGPGVSLSTVQSKTLFCTGEQVTLQSAFTSGGYTSPEYQWQYSSDNGVTWNNIPGATSSNYSISSVASSQGGMYQLFIAETGNINLSSCRIVAGPITFSVSGNVTTSSFATICSGTTATLTATGSGSYLWSNGSTASSITVNPLVTTSYTVIGTTGTCTSQAVSTVSVIPGAAMSVVPSPSLICVGETATLTAIGFTTYSWTPAQGLSAGTGSVAVATPTSTSQYTVTGTGPGCPVTTVVTVSVVPVPTLILSPDTYICSGSVLMATLTAGGASSYTWSNSSSLSSSTGSMVTASPGSTTTYTVTGLLGVSCTNTAVVTVSVIATPTISSVSVNHTSCGLANGSATVSSLPSGNTYSWSPGVTSLTNTAFSLAGGSYTVSVTNGSCATATVIGILNSVPITILSNTVIPTNCNGNTGSIRFTDNLAGSTYSWNPGVSTTTDAYNLAAGNYSVTITNVACTASTVFTVGLISGPTAITTTITKPVCGNANGKITVTGVVNGTNPYQYSFNNAGFSSTTVYPGLPAGTYTLAVKDNIGCVYTNTVAVNDTTISFDLDLVTNAPNCLANDGSFFVNGIKGGTPPYLLSFNYAPFSNTVHFEPLGPGTYTLTVMDSNRCKTPFVLTMPENNGDYTLYVPNSFTPNKDRLNDIWYIKGTCLGELSCTIYNRWGEKLIEINDISNGWDGTYKGAEVPDGVYVYSLRVHTETETITKTGHITLFR